MSAYADLEITFRKRDERSYVLRFRFNSPNDEAEKVSDPDPVVMADFSALKDEDPAYGTKLSGLLFTEEVKDCFNKFRGLALGQDSALRVRLTIESSAPELHSVHWETLRDPGVTDRDVPLFMNERLPISRFLSGGGNDWRPIRLQPKARLKALVVVANPPARFKDSLASIDVAGEVEIARKAMADIDVSQLVSGGEKPPTLNNLAAKLREGFDILYVVCHGVLSQQEPYLYLDGDADAGPTPGQALVQAIDNLDYRPRLIVLASCQSAGQGQSGLAALGPRLARVGVPAVIAMQGNVYMKTAEQFMETFFTELCRDGQIDRAMAVARAAVFQLERVDYWKPVLFMRLRNGRIWYVPGFDGTKDEFAQWDAVCTSVREGNFVPVLGPDIAEHILGSTHSLASELARIGSFPAQSSDGFDLAKVAQYILTKESRRDVQTKVIAGISKELARTGERVLKRPVAGDPDLMGSIVQELSKEGSGAANTDPLVILANLNASVYINASGDTLLERFLRRTAVDGKLKEPVPLTAEWRDEAQSPRNGGTFLGDPTIERPFVYYMFGQMGNTSNWVLTEDDYFDYLIQTATYKLMPPVIGDALVSNRLLFLGFPIDDLKFRVMFRLILAKGGRKLSEEYSHVGVQVDPSETTPANAQRAKKYMERYFRGSSIDIYWGSSADFLRELKVQLDKAPAPVAQWRL